MKFEDIQLPEGHVVVYLGDRKMGPGEFMQVVGDHDDSGPYGTPIAPSRVILYPEGFRVVPRGLVGEWATLLDRQQREIDQFRRRVTALPQIRVQASIVAGC